MKDHYFFMCTTPGGEKCANLGELDYCRNARIEAEAFIRQLQRIYGEAPSGTSFRIVDCPHDFGVYLDVRFNFDDDDCAHTEYLDRLQESAEHWDAAAREELIRAGYTLGAGILKVSHRAA